MTFGSSKWRQWVLDEKESSEVVRAAVDRGINFIDFADFYSIGVSEEVVSRALSNYQRQNLIYTSKCFYSMSEDVNDRGLSRKHIFDSIDGSLRRLKTDYLDMFMIHAFDPHTPIEETMSALHDIVKAGKVRYIGASTMFAWQFAKMNEVARVNGWTTFSTMQCQLNAAYREEEREMIPYCIHEGIAVTPFSPLARGLLSGNASSLRNTSDQFTNFQYGDEVSQNIAKAVAKVALEKGVSSSQIALAWVMSRKGVTSTLIGVETIEQLDANIATLNIQISDEEMQSIDRHYTPCDVINDYVEKRIPRVVR
jgi:aryl-alcohol dehydrogenase-like predicted oxidoreductase